MNPMPITIQPGVSALLELINHDEAFAVDLKKGVVAEVTRKLLPETIESIYLGVIKHEVAAVRQSLLVELARDEKRLDVVVKDLIDKTVKDLRAGMYQEPTIYKTQREQLEGAVAPAIADIVRKEVEKFLTTKEPDTANIRSAFAVMVDDKIKATFDRMEKVIATRVEKVTGEMIDAEVKRRVEERVAMLRAVLKD